MKRMRKAVALGYATAVALYALPLWAADAEGGLPQLNFALYPEQLFWLAVTFTLLFVVMNYVALPGVRRTQESRHLTLTDELAAATAAHEQAKATALAGEKAIVEARAKAQAIVEEINSREAQIAFDKHAAQDKELLHRLQEADKRIAVMRDAAIQEMRSLANELASQIVEKVSGLKIQVQK